MNTVNLKRSSTAWCFLAYKTETIWEQLERYCLTDRCKKKMLELRRNIGDSFGCWKYENTNPLMDWNTQSDSLQLESRGCPKLETGVHSLSKGGSTRRPKGSNNHCFDTHHHELCKDAFRMQ